MQSVLLEYVRPLMLSNVLVIMLVRFGYEKAAFGLRRGWYNFWKRSVINFTNWIQMHGYVFTVNCE